MCLSCIVEVKPEVVNKPQKTYGKVLDFSDDNDVSNDKNTIDINLRGDAIQIVDEGISISSSQYNNSKSGKRMDNELIAYDDFVNENFHRRADSDST